MTEKLLAPNGKPSNLNPEQYKLVRTKAFKDWFGDWEKDPENASKVVDENGEPKVMYSGSPYKFTIFKTEGIEVDRDDKEFKPRFWFIANKGNAEDYSRKATGNISSVYECFLNIRNPKYDFNLYVEDNEDGSVEFRNKEIWVAIATSSNQIKLADGTNTTFDGNNPDIRFEGGGSVLLAPNGKPSNLNPEQYKLVRTKAFKDWFGDWENDPANASKVVDENGEPLVVYHGTKSWDIYEFDLSKSKRISSGLKEFGTYFTDNKKLAESYRDWTDLKKEQITDIDKEIYRWEEILYQTRNNRDYDYAEQQIKALKEFKKGKIYSVFLNLKKMYSFDAKKETNIEAWNNLEVKASYKLAINRDAMDFLKEGKFGVEKVDGIQAKNIVDAFVQTEELKKELLSNVYLVFDSKNIKLADGTNTTFDGNNPDIRFMAGGNVEDLISKGIVELKMFDTKPEHAKEYGLDSVNPLYIQTLSVTENERLQGIGNEVLKYIDDYAIRNGHDVVFGHITQKAEPNIDIIKTMLIKSGFNTCEGNNDFYKKIDIRFEEGGLVDFTFEKLPDDYKDFYQIRAFKNIGGEKYYFSRLNTYTEKNVFTIETKEGKEIARATLNETENYLINIRVDENYRRKGLALNLYNFIEKVIGAKLNPSPDKISNEAKGLWIKRNPNIRFNSGGLIAPNGKPSNLNPEQYKLVRTPEFKAWFGDWENDPENSSKIVDENGEPKVMYHGARAKFTVFSDVNENKLSWTEGGKGFYFTSLYDNAFAYGENVLACFIKANPIISDGKQHAFVTEYDLNKIKSWGSDAIYFDGEILNTQGKWVMTADELVVFEPNQIKLADGTNTTFDANNDDIRYAGGGELGVENFKKMNYNELMLYIKDSYKELGAEIGVKGHTEDGEPIIGYLPYQNEYMYKSDSTGKNIRFYIDLGNEKYIHPSEINPKFNVSEQKRIEQKADYFAKISNEEYNKIISELEKNNELNLVVDTLNKALKTFNIENQYDSSDIFKSYGNSILESKDGNKRRMKFDVYYFRVNDSELKTNVKNLDLERFNNEYLKKDKFKKGGEIKEFVIGATYSGKYVQDIVSNYDSQEGTDMKEFASDPDKINPRDKYILEYVNIKYLLENDINLRTFISEEYNPEIEVDYQEITEPILLGYDQWDNTPNVVLDGFHRVLQALYNGQEEIIAFVNYKTADKIIHFSKGGRTIAQTPAPKKERIYGSEKNKPESSKDTKSAEKIEFNEKTLETIKNKVAEHNENNPNKKVTLASAKAVVRRGMGAYSSSHRPTISGGKPNSRVAWGLARLNAFLYKIINGKSKSGKYNQDDDLINELGYKVKKYIMGGDVNYENQPRDLSQIENYENIYKGAEFYSFSDSSEKQEKADRWFELFRINQKERQLTTSEFREFMQLSNELSWEEFADGGEIKTEYQFRDVGGVALYYKRENGGKWSFITKEQFDQNAKSNNIIIFNSKMEKNPKDTITMDIPLFIRMLELAREDIKSDAELHQVVERVIDLKDKDLNMDDYDYIVETMTSEVKQYAKGGSITSILKRPYARLFFYIYNDAYGNMELGENRIEMESKAGTSIVDGVFLNLGECLNAFVSFCYSDWFKYIMQNQKNSNFEIRSSLYDGISYNEFDESVVRKEKSILSISTKTLSEYIELERFERGGQVKYQDNLESLLKSEGWSISFYDRYINEVPKEKAYEMSLVKFEPFYENVRIKLPSKKEVAFDWVMEKINKDSVYKSFSDTFKAILSKNNIHGSVYPTTYGIGVMAFGNIDSTRKKIEQILTDAGIEFYTEWSDADFVLRFKISKSKTNIEKIQHLQNEYAKGGQTEAQKEKIQRVMHEFKQGKLNTSYGEKVTSPKQAIAIALSEANVEKKEIGGSVKYNKKGIVDSIKSKEGEIPLKLESYWFDDDAGVELVPVSELVKFREFDRTKKPKWNEDESKRNINYLKNAFNKDGIKEPLIIEYNHEDRMVLLVEGNHRLNSAIEMGLEYLPARVRLNKYGTYKGDKKKSAMSVKGVEPNEFGYIPSDLKPSQVGIAGSVAMKFEEGGIIEGQLHSECNEPHGCGEKFQVGEGGSIIEAERDEAVIVSNTFKDSDEYTIKGTPSEIASALNVLGGGKNFDKGATIEKDGKEVNLPEMKNEAQDTNVEPIIEGGSIIINRRSMADDTNYEVTGTPRQIASAINSVDGNGVVIEKGADLKKI